MNTKNSATDESAESMTEPISLSPSMQWFLELVAGLCAELGCDDPERVLGGGSLAVAGVDFRLTYLEPIDAQWLVVSCNAVAVPEAAEEELYLNALERNGCVNDGYAPVFALDAELKHVICLARLRLDTLTVNTLREKLTAFAGLMPELTRCLMAPRASAALFAPMEQGGAIDQWRSLGSLEQIRI